MKMQLLATIACPLCDNDIGLDSKVENAGEVYCALLTGHKPGAFCPKCLTRIHEKRANSKRWLSTVKTWLNLPEDKRI